MPESRGRSRTPTVATLALTPVLALLSGAALLWAEKRASGTEHWQGKEIEYELSGKASSDAQFFTQGAHLDSAIADPVVQCLLFRIIFQQVPPCKKI